MQSSDFYNRFRDISHVHAEIMIKKHKKTYPLKSFLVDYIYMCYLVLLSLPGHSSYILFKK